ncbi:MAG TPA: hypothetical protein VJ901_20190 [Thermoanaerobaculia bacterium]|nr:hypothetical protein [Thermoanaerobaculia bacterium]
MRNLIALLLFATSLTAQDRFTDRDLNFSIATPASDWKWSTVAHKELGEYDGVLYVSDPHGERFSITVTPTGNFKVDEHLLYAVQTTLRFDAEAAGFHIGEFHTMRTTSPIFPSYTYSYTRIDKNGKVMYVEGYLAALNRIYTIQYASESRNAMDDFKRFVASFQLANKFEAQRGGTGPATSPFASISGAMKSTLGQPLAPNELEPIRK